MGADKAKTRTLYLRLNVSLGTEKHSNSVKYLKMELFAKIFSVNRKPLSQDASP